jgi:hypothetical protein
MAPVVHLSLPQSMLNLEIMTYYFCYERGTITDHGRNVADREQYASHNII